MLLKSLIFHYHGLDEEEKSMLKEAAKNYNAEEELIWANAFISEDYLSAFERSREFLFKVLSKMKVEDRISYLMESWEENFKKGYITEMETTAILTLSQDWKVEKEFLARVKG
ncbi:MAG: hypothetical protein AAF616_02105 [Bacteroidota bacterium]